MAAPTHRARPLRSLLVLVVTIVALGATIGLSSAFSDGTVTPKLALDLEGGTQIILTPVTDDGQKVTQGDVNQAIAVIRQRIDSSGVSEAVITSQGGRNIVVEIPGVPDPETVKLVTTSARMEFRPVLSVAAPGPVADPTATPTADPSASTAPDAAPTDAATAAADDTAASPSPSATPTADATAPADGSGTAAGPTSPSDTAYYLTPELLKEFNALDCTDPANLTGGAPGAADKAVVACEMNGTAKYALGPVEVDGTDLSGADSGLKSGPNGAVTGEWVVNLKLDGSGTKKFADASTRLYGLKAQPPLDQFAIVLDGLIVSAPQINQPILDGNAQISGNFTRDSAGTLANQLNFGSLPLTFEVQSQDQISATLGSEQLEKGLIAGLIGLILVVVYSMFQYRVLGLLTVGSLGIAAVLSYGVITVLSWTMGYRMSLAGVAGLIVAIGITADSFIVYFERIKDELREGRSLGQSVDRGWLRARRTILASDAVSFLAAAVLYLLAVGGVRGFAFTLGLTTIIDLVVVFLFTHPLMVIFARHKFFAGGHPASGLDPRRLGGSGTTYAGRGRVVTAAERGAASDGLTIAERKAARQAAEASTQEEAVVAPRADTTDSERSDS